MALAVGLGCTIALRAADEQNHAEAIATETLAAGTGWNYWQSEASGGAQIELPQGGPDGGLARGFRRVSRGIVNKVFSLAPGPYEVRFWSRRTGKTGSLKVTVEPETLIHPLSRQIVPIEPGPDWEEIIVVFRVPGPVGEGDTPGRTRVMFEAHQVDDDLLLADFRISRRPLTSPVVNGDFEQEAGLGGWKDAYWKGLEAHGVAARAEGGVSGGASAVVKHVSGQEKVGISQIVLATALSATRDWVLDGWTRTEQAGSSDLGVRLLDSAGEILWQREAVGARDAAHANAGWIPLKQPFRLLPGTAAVELVAIHLGPGESGCDAIDLRPATVQEMAGFDPLPSRIGITPLDSTHRLREYGAAYHYPVLSRQPNMVAVHLDSPNFKPDAACLEIVLPKWLVLTRIARGYAPWSPEPVTPQREERSDCTVYRVTQLASWNATKGRSDSNQYEILVLDPRAEPGTRGTAEISLLVDGQTEARLPFTVEVLPSLADRPVKSRFPIMLWSVHHALHPGAEAEAVLETYVRAGLSGGVGLAANLVRKPLADAPGWSHVYSLPVSSHLPHVRNIMGDAAPAAIEAAGTASAEYTNLGRCIGDDELRTRWREAVAPILRSLPPDPVVFWNGEFWGRGSTKDICFSPETLALFTTFAGLPAGQPLDAAAILRDCFDQWSAFRQWTTAQVTAKDAEAVRRVRSDARVAIYTYPLTLDGKAPRFVRDAPMNPLLWEEGADINLVSMYSLFGTTYLDILDATVKGLQKPVWSCPYLTKTVQVLGDTAYSDCDALEWHLEIIGAAATGAEGMAPYPGCVLDGHMLTLTRRAIDAVEAHADFYLDGERRDEQFAFEGDQPDLRLRGHAARDGRLLLTLFNTSRQPRQATVTGPGGRAVHRLLEPMEVAIIPW